MRSVALMLTCWCACTLGGSQPQYDYFVLTPTHVGARSRESATDRPTVGITEVNLPGYLDRESIVTRTDDHRLVYSKHDRWAEPLDQAFERTLRQDLAAILAPVGIAVPRHAGAPTYDLRVEVLRFERCGAERVELWARWLLRTDSKVVESGESRIQLPVQGTGSNAVAAALSEAVARFASAIADRVRTASAGDRAS